MSLKTVLHIAPTPFFADRGCHIRIEGIVDCLAELGYQNLVCTYHHGRDVATVKTSRIAPIINYTKTEAGPSKYKLWADWKLLWLLVKEIRRTKPAVIHAHLHEGLMIGLVAKTLLFWKKIPLVADMQGSLVGELEAHGSFKKNAWLRWPVKAVEAGLMFFAKTIICSSDHSLAKIKTEFSLNDAKVSLVQDGARVAPRPSDIDRLQLRNKLGLPENKKIVVYSGALLESKGLAELKQLISICGQNEMLHFLIIGYPVEEFDVYLNQQGLAGLCTLTGQVEFEKLPSYLQLADVAIDPKFSDAGEGSGKILNYLACGLPVLAFDSQNNRNFLPAETELSKSVEAMASQLAQVIADEVLLKNMGDANLAHFESNYSWNQTKSQLAAIYQRL
ncbi:MAG: glycosyltransferase family 4 protein [Arenicella sp.]|nr:glycosyltransferase family 4 protein [Arenicella sp.]